MDELLQLLPSLPDAAPLATDVAAGAVRTIAEVAAVDLAAVSPGALPAGADLDAWPQWTVQDVRRALEAFARCAHQPPGVLLARAQEDVQLRAQASAHEAYRVAHDVKALQTARLLPDGEVLARLVRYESHLAQELEKTTRLLTDLQARRQDRVGYQQRR
jgi:hypothetical protein